MKIALINYGMGNLHSVAKALERASGGGEVCWVETPEQLLGSDVVVLPGVGAFGMAAENLRKRKLWEPIAKWLQDEKPFLGICLGYQLLFERSEEAGPRVKGFGIFKGAVKRLPRKKNLRIPHMGWNTLELSKTNGKQIFKKIPDGSYFYFVHSFAPDLKQPKYAASRTAYGARFASSVARKNLFASQFHPEKSGEAGLLLLRNFLNDASHSGD